MSAPVHPDQALAEAALLARELQPWQLLSALLRSPDDCPLWSPLAWLRLGAQFGRRLPMLNLFQT